MVKTEGGDHPNVIAPPPLLFAAWIGAGFLAQQIWPLPHLGWSGARAIGVLLVTLGMALSAWSIMQFVRHGTHPDPYRPTTQIIVTGPFIWSRNPIYVGYALMHAGIGLWAGSFWVLSTVLPALGITHVWVVLPEERYLQAKFGERYLQYKRGVHRWL